MDVLASGYGLVEGPRADERGGVYFSDVHRGGVYRLDANGALETVVPKRRGVGGIALHADGGVVVSGRNICHVKDGQTRVVFGPEGGPGFNDLTVDASGAVLTGSIRDDPFKASTQRVAGEAYRITGDGQAHVVYDDVSLSNGIGLSPDGSRIYHSDTARRHIIVHRLTDTRQCVDRGVLAETPRGAPDGLAVDEAGCVWVAAYGGGCVTRFTPDGAVDMHLEVPATAVTSLSFGGADRRELYIASADNTEAPELGGTLFRTRVQTGGLAVPLARI